MKKFLPTLFVVQIFFLIFGFSFVVFTSNILAQKEVDLSVSPAVIDASAAPRAMLEYSVLLKNNTNHKLNIFPLLLDLKEREKINTAGLIERQYLMTKWLSINRGSVEVLPGAEKTISLDIDIPNDAIPGDYFVSITFAHGAHRLEAEENALKMNPPRLLVNLRVEDQSVEKLSILKYYPVKKISTKPNPMIGLELNNSGTVDLTPRGKVLVYNKRNQEVDAIEVNPELETVLAGEIFDFDIQLNNNLSTGKYKARLELEYGDKISRDINDTVYFIVITKLFLIYFVIGLLLFIVLLSKLIFRRTYHHQSFSGNQEQIKKISTKKEEEVINLKS